MFLGGVDVVFLGLLERGGFREGEVFCVVGSWLELRLLGILVVVGSGFLFVVV